MPHAPLIENLEDRARTAAYCERMASLWGGHVELTNGIQSAKAEAYADAFRSARFELCGDTHADPS